MKHQKVSVDVWVMMKSMLGYLALTILGGMFLRLLITVVTLPRRFAQQRDTVDKALKDLQEKYPECFNEAASEANKTENEKESPTPWVDTKRKTESEEVPGPGDKGEAEKKDD